MKERELALMPANISFEEAAGIPLAALTAYQVQMCSVSKVTGMSGAHKKHALGSTPQTVAFQGGCRRWMPRS